MADQDSTCQATKVSRRRRVLAVLDLGTNNCRLMVAIRKRGLSFSVVDSFSRIVRLGEGIATTGRISDAAQERAIAALKDCAEIIARWEAEAVRCVTTEACRIAENGPAFVEQVRQETGLRLEIIDPAEEARLALKGCQNLIDPEAKRAVLFDIGGGSTELCFVEMHNDQNGQLDVKLLKTATMPLGVVRLSEGVPEGGFSASRFEEARHATSEAVRQRLPDGFEVSARGADHLIGTSGTSTSLAAMHKGLTRYRRRDVDGSWLHSDDIGILAQRLDALGFEGRSKQPAIGEGRADLIMPGCAILQGILDAIPARRVRVADRGLREGLVMELLEAGQGHWRRPRRERVSSSR